MIYKWVHMMCNSPSWFYVNMLVNIMVVSATGYVELGMVLVLEFLNTWQGKC